MRPKPGANNITSAAPLRVSLTFVDGGAFGTELASGSPGGFISTGAFFNGGPVYEPDSLYTLQTGDYAAGFSSDVAITVIASAVNLSNFYINPDPAAGTTVPLGKIDLLSVLTHEFGHGLGFLGLINRVAPAAGSFPISSGAAVGVYDQFVSDTTVAGNISADFTGANAEAAYGQLLGTGLSTPVPLYETSGSGLSVENFYHLSPSVGALSNDLMEAQLASGMYLPISNLDLAILQDTGVPVTANVECFAHGTRIRTVSGEMPVETLRVGVEISLVEGGSAPIVWIGRLQIRCSLHPAPERVYPVRVSTHAFGPGLPSGDLLLSPNHAVYVRGVLIPVRLLVNGINVSQAAVDEIDYYHIELPKHQVIFAEGLAVESYLDCGGRTALSGGHDADMAAAASSLAAEQWEALGYAPMTMHGPVLEAVRENLLSNSSLIPA